MKNIAGKAIICIMKFFQRLLPSLTRIQARSQAGFTLIELIMVLVILGVLAVFVAPRLNVSDFDAPGFHDQTLALLRYAQKSAIAQRRTVCVTFTGAGATLTIAANTGVFACAGNNLGGPRGERPASVVARGTVAYNPQPGNFGFDAQGQPIDTTNAASLGAILGQQIIQVAGLNRTIIVEAVTGYVHD